MTHFVPTERIADNRYRLPVTEELCVGPRGQVFLFGGAGLAASVKAMEESFGRQLVWATAQYVSFARIGATVELEVVAAQSGRNVSQALVTGRVDGDVIFNVMGSVGEREGYPDQHWRDMPDVPPPEDCEDEPQRPEQDPSARLRQRLIVRARRDISRHDVAMQTGRTDLWVRQLADDPVDSAMLAIFADFVPGAIGGALGRRGGGNSLDNSLRVRKIVPTEWVLCVVQAQAAARGFGHGHMRLYAQDGTLMATASQSIILRTYAERAAKGAREAESGQG